MKRNILSVACMALLASASTSTWANNTWAAYPAWSRSSDSDGLIINKWFAGALPAYGSGMSWRGVEWQQQRYEQNGQQLSGNGVNYTVQETDVTTGLGYNYKIGINQGPHQTLVTGDWSWNKAFTPQLQWGLFASRDWVESMAALQNNVHYELLGGNIDYQVHPRLTLIGSVAQTHFSDGQSRQQQRTRVVFDAWPEQGITLQASHKHQIGEKDATVRRYFNPEQLDETMGFVGWRRRFEGWQWYARAGSGRQHVVNEASTPARLAELQISSPVRGNSYFRLRTGESETRGINGPGYVYRYFDVQWIWRLDR